MSDNDWNLKKTEFSRVTINPLRTLWERNQPKANPAKTSIILQAGDPTTFGNFPPHPACAKALRDALEVDKFGYNESKGHEAARKAIAEYSSHMGNVTANDVIITTGCSMAIEFCFMALANPGENILIPCPAWNYITWLRGARIEPRFYNLDPAKSWDVDLKHMESLIDKKTKAILINSPGNPCGNVFSKEHILEIIEIAERYKLPIIADEIYEFFTFSGLEFHSVASLSKNVPVLTCSGLTKRFLIPGIRIDWLIINDRGDKLRDIREGLINIAGRNFGPNSTIQLALPGILKNVPQSYFDDSKEKVGRHATTVYNLLKKVLGLNPIMPKGAFYMMIGIEFDKFPKFKTCLEFMRGLAMEQSVFVFPGEVFFFPGFIRVILTPTEKSLTEACERIKEFCETHYVK